jgi:hypothetical protein
MTGHAWGLWMGDEFFLFVDVVSSFISFCDANSHSHPTEKRMLAVSGVSSKDLQRARRIAKRARAAVACQPCRVSKVKCNDYRPCASCKKQKTTTECDGGTAPQSEYSGLGVISRDLLNVIRIINQIHFLC